jgi:Tfp pilus assembly protein PilN
VSTQTVQGAPGGVARVNLMPPEIAEQAQLRQLQAVMGVAVLLAIVIIGALWFHERSAVSSAKDGLASAQLAEQGLQSKLASLAPVKQTEAELQAKQGLLTTALGTEVRWSYLLNDMSFRLPSGVYLTSMSVTQSANPATGQIAQVSFSDIGGSYNDVALTLEALAKERTFINPTFGSSTESSAGGRKTVNFSTTVGVTSQAYSGRYSAAAAAASPQATP